MIKIRTPIWKTMSIGIAEDKMTSDSVEVQITYKTKDKKRMYPDTYTIPRIVVMQLPIQMIKGHKVHIIPISMLRSKQ